MLVKLYCGIITRSLLQLINTSIDAFFSRLCAFLRNKEEVGRPMMIQRKLDGIVDEFLVDHEIRKSNTIVCNL